MKNRQRKYYQRIERSKNNLINNLMAMILDKIR